MLYRILQLHFMKYPFILVFFFTYNLQAQSGVGTNIPINKLHILGDTASPLKSGVAQNSLMRLSNTSSVSSLDFGISKDNYSWIQARSSSSYAVNYPILLNPIGGNVGVGITSPSEKLSVNGSVLANGTIRSVSAGQILNSVFLNETDLGISNNIQNSSTTETTVVSYTYNPVSSSSKIYIEFDTRAIISGGGPDELVAYINVGSSKIQANSAVFNTAQGGGGRGNALFPIQGYYVNSSTNNITISITMARVNSDDTITVSPDMTLIIQEVAR